MIRAQLKLGVPDNEASKSLVQAVQPDNLAIAGLEVTGTLGRRSVAFSLAYRGRIETFIFTLDDMLRCLQAAKETIESVTKNWSSACVKSH